MVKKIKKVIKTNSSAAFDSSNQQPINTAPIQDAATNEKVPANGGAPDTPDTGAVAVPATPVKPVSPTSSAATEVPDNFVHKALQARGINDGEYAIRFPADPPDETDEKFVVRQTCYMNPIEGANSSTVIDARRVLDKIQKELCELTLQLPVQGRAASACRLAANIIHSTNSNVKFDLPPCYVPIENVAHELGVDARVFSETARTLGAQKGKYHFLHNDNMYIDSRVANEILRCHSAELAEIDRFGFSCYNPTSLVPQTLQLILGTKDAAPGYPGIELE